MPARIDINPQRLVEFCRRHHIRKLALFGSVLRDDFAPDSDVDVLYEFEPGREPGWNIQLIQDELSDMIGRPVDLVPLKYLSPRIRDRVLAGAEIQYAA